MLWCMWSPRRIWLDHIVMFMFLRPWLELWHWSCFNLFVLSTLIICLITSWWCYVAFGVWHGLIDYRCLWILRDVGDGWSSLVIRDIFLRRLLFGGFSRKTKGAFTWMWTWVHDGQIEEIVLGVSHKWLGYPGGAFSFPFLFYLAAYDLRGICPLYLSDVLCFMLYLS